MCCLLAPSPPKPAPHPHPSSLAPHPDPDLLSTFRLESYYPQLIQAAFCPDVPSPSLHFYCQALLNSLGFLCFVFPIVQILPCKGARGSWRLTVEAKFPLSLFVSNSTLFLLTRSSPLDLQM